MKQPLDGRAPVGKRLKREALFYVGVCGVAFLLLAMGGRLLPELFAGAFTEMLLFLVPGGVVMFLALACFLPSAEQSEFFRVFECLYHPGICLLAAAAFADSFAEQGGTLAGYLHMAYIAGWMLLAAGIIVLVLILKEKHH